jgi:hypothetical protein
MEGLRAQAKTPTRRNIDNAVSEAVSKVQTMGQRGGLSPGSLTGLPPSTWTTQGEDEDGNAYSISPLIWGLDSWGDMTKKWSKT